MKKLMILAILLVMAVAALDLFYREEVKPDTEYPMVNQHVEYCYGKVKNPR